MYYIEKNLLYDLNTNYKFIKLYLWIYKIKTNIDSIC